MDFSFGEEQELWRRTLNDFTDREGGAEYTRRCDLEQRFPQEWWDKGVEQGWLGLLVPEKYGGTDIDATMFVIFCEAISKYSFEMGDLFFAPLSFRRFNLSAVNTPFSAITCFLRSFSVIVKNLVPNFSTFAQSMSAIPGVSGNSM